MALSDLGRYVSVDVRSIDSGSGAGARGRRGRRQGHPSLPEHLRDRAAQPGSARTDPTTSSASTPTMSTSSAGPARRSRSEVLFADEGEARGKSEVLFASLTNGGRNAQVLSLQASSDDGVVDCYDETGKEREEIPRPQAARRRQRDLEFRLAPASSAAVHARCTPASTGAPRPARRSMPRRQRRH